MPNIVSYPGPTLLVSPTLYSGIYMVYGTVKNTGTPNFPVFRRLRLHDSHSGNLVQETWSDAITGDYNFRYLADRSYYVVSFDHTGQYNGVIATDVPRILMP
jgi:hypothetical protein